MSLISPHGGKLVNRVLQPDAAQAASQSAGSLPSITLSAREQGDLEMIAIGAFSPLTGFMGSEDFAWMLLKRPGCYIWIGNGDGAGSCMVHNPGYDFNDDILPIGASYWATLVEQQLSRQAMPQAAE